MYFFIAVFLLYVFPRLFYRAGCSNASCEKHSVFFRAYMPIFFPSPFCFFFFLCLFSRRASRGPCARGIASGRKGRKEIVRCARVQSYSKMHIDDRIARESVLSIENSTLAFRDIYISPQSSRKRASRRVSHWMKLPVSVCFRVHCFLHSIPPLRTSGARSEVSSQRESRCVTLSVAGHYTCVL